VDYAKIDIENLLTPVLDGGTGVGEDLRSGSDPEALYLALKDLRAEARGAEREAAVAEDNETPPLQAGLRYWWDVAETAPRILAGATKDLEIAGWLTEALLRTGSFQGLSQGLELMARLIETFWEAGLHPQEDEEGVETRLGSLFGLIGRGMTGALVQPIKLLPLSDRADLQPAALWLFETVAASPPRAEDPEARERQAAKQAEQLEALNQAVAGSSPEFLRATFAGVKGALANLDRLMDAIDSRTDVGRFSSQVAEPLRAIAELLQARVGHLFVEAKADDPGAVEDAVAPAADGSPAAPRGAPSGRAEALNSILQIADFFERTEPQSIVAGSLRDVVRRAKLPLTDLLLELLPEEEARTRFLLRAGIRDDRGMT
jgi:type VI secretion system protein ImpA